MCSTRSLMLLSFTRPTYLLRTWSPVAPLEVPVLGILGSLAHERAVLAIFHVEFGIETALQELACRGRYDLPRPQENGSTLRSNERKPMTLWQDFLTNDDRVIHKWVHYFPVYERHFQWYRNKSLTFLEIGVARGGSLGMWQRFFGTLARVVGIDIGEGALSCCYASPSQIRGFWTT
jgi:hypothetical protein